MNHEDLEEKGADFIARFLAARETERNAMKADGAKLAGRLRRRAIDLAHSKATEFSPAIRACHLLAAKVALLAYWPDTRSMDGFERDIRYYRNFESTRSLVDDYEAFRAAYTAR